MAIRSNATSTDHGDITGFDSAAALSGCWWGQIVTGGHAPGITKGGQFYLYMPDADDIAGGQTGVWEYRTTGLGLTTGVWYHFAFVYDGSLAAANRWKIWVDGVAQTLTGTTPGTTLSNQGTSTVKTIKNTTGDVDGFMGQLKMWLAVLTETEIKQEMHSNRPVRTTNLSLWAPYDDALNVKDYSGNANHGSVGASTTSVNGPPVSFGG